MVFKYYVSVICTWCSIVENTYGCIKINDFHLIIPITYFRKYYINDGLSNNTMTSNLSLVIFSVSAIRL